MIKKSISKSDLSALIIFDRLGTFMGKADFIDGKDPVTEIKSHFTQGQNFNYLWISLLNGKDCLTNNNQAHNYIEMLSN